MNKDLIKRIDEYAKIWHNYSISGLFKDCKAEIQRLLLANETLKELNVEYLERVKILETELWRESKAREYVTMTDEEWEDLVWRYGLDERNTSWCRYIEAEVIKRARLNVEATPFNCGINGDPPQVDHAWTPPCKIWCGRKQCAAKEN